MSERKFLLLAVVGLSPACVGETGEPSGGKQGAGVGGTASVSGVGGTDPGTGGLAGVGGEPGTAAGGTSVVGSGGAVGAGTGGSIAGSGGASTVPVDCSGITAAGYELCETTADSCGAVFEDSSGCSAVCAAAGLECQSAYENAESACAADIALPALACESGHQSDYCLCGRPPGGSGGASSGGAGSGGEASGGAGSGGAATGGAPGTGGTTPAGSDCNTATDQPVIEVRKDGSGNFTKVQDAINSLPGSNATPTIIRIAPGSYYEKLIVNRPNITLCGQVGQAASTLLTYSDGADTNNVGTTGSASVNLSGDDVSVENITFENTRGIGSQAVALLVSGNRVQFRNSRFIGNQDTLYVRGGPLYFRDCYVEGTVDFIFGDATAVFEDCTIHNVGGGTAVTAPSTDQANPYGIVFLGGELTAAGGVSSGSVNLGRNWRPYGSTTYIETVLGAHISSVGWVKMSDNVLSTARFSEFQTSGPGANPGARAAESKQLSAGEAAAFTVDDIFGSWDPTYAD